VAKNPKLAKFLPGSRLPQTRWIDVENISGRQFPREIIFHQSEAVIFFIPALPLTVIYQVLFSAESPSLPATQEHLATPAPQEMND
jgi:hypothetical protein